MTSLQVYVFISHTRIVLSREPVIILDLDGVSFPWGFSLGQRLTRQIEHSIYCLDVH